MYRFVLADAEARHEFVSFIFFFFHFYDLLQSKRISSYGHDGPFQLGETFLLVGMNSESCWFSNPSTHQDEVQ